MRGCPALRRRQGHALRVRATPAALTTPTFRASCRQAVRLTLHAARQYVKHKSYPNRVVNALIFQENFWSTKMRDFRPRASPKMTKNTLFYIVEGDRAHREDGETLPVNARLLSRFGAITVRHLRSRSAYRARRGMHPAAPCGYRGLRGRSH